MGMANACYVLLILFFPALCQASCTTFFLQRTYFEIYDNDTYEEGTVIGDYSDDVDNKTLMFLPGTGNCASILAINGSKLVLKENLLNQALCNFDSVSCDWSCAESPGRKNSLRVFIHRVSRKVFKFKSNSYSVNVPESASTGTELISFSKSDLTREDCVPLTNVFFRLNGNEQNFFGSRTGTDKITIFLNKKLDYEDSKNHTLNIIAELLDTAEENSTSLLVNVTDVDDMDPTFDHDVYYLNITENDNASINVSLNVTPKIHAFDRDMGAGRQEVFYRFADNSNKHGCFSIDKTTGNISVSCPYDREDREFYSLTIKAVQQNTESRSCTATLSVRILDVNDNTPEFMLTSYHVNVTEHSGRGTLIDTVTANDKDQDEKAQDVNYEILPPHNTAFSVNKNGEIRVEDPSKLDREAGNGTMILKVKAIDSENRKPSTSTATVTITLLDANDNAPIFDAPKYTFRLSSDPGKVLGHVKAVDDDEANTPNSEIRYKLHKTLWSSSFSIDNKTGNITVKERPTITTGQIELIVEAQDLGVPPLQSSVAVLLSQVEVNGDTVNFTVLKSAEEVTKKKDFYQSEIGKILKLQVSLDKIGSLQTRRISCYIIVSATFQNNSVVTGNILENLVLQHMSEILALFNEPHDAQKAVSSEETFTPTVISLIVICCLLIVGTIILIIYIHQTTKKFERVKRLQDNLTRKSSLYESQELKIQMPDEQTSDYNGSLIGSQDLPSIQNSSGDLKERVVSAYTNSVFTADETSVNLTVAEKEAEKSLNDLTNVLDAEETKVMVVDSYNPSESDTEFETEVKISQGYENVPYPPGYENVPHKFKSNDVPEDYPTGDPNESEFGTANSQENKQIEEDEEPNPDYDVKAVRFSEQVLDTEENKFEPLREKEDHAELKKDEESGEDIDDDDDVVEDHEDEESTADVNEEVDERKDDKDDKDDDFGDGIESERTDEEILSPNETLHDENNPDEDAIPHFSFDTKM
uniref:Protocadherin-like wing polarity protein stan isoform X1 n=1 Tax=Crassostrea virginica TaxID=6565 RepID=A0A8B8BDZ5_CRAVI|nr:protocadherin-like wing polarity protein stan isoform X1 [Crassostrea virginica]